MRKCGWTKHTTWRICCQRCYDAVNFNFNEDKVTYAWHLVFWVLLRADACACVCEQERNEGRHRTTARHTNEYHRMYVFIWYMVYSYSKWRVQKVQKLFAIFSFFMRPKMKGNSFLAMIILIFFAQCATPLRSWIFVRLVRLHCMYIFIYYYYYYHYIYIIRLWECICCTRKWITHS